MSLQIEIELRNAKKTVEMIKAELAKTLELNHKLHAERCKWDEAGKPLMFNRRRDLKDTCKAVQILTKQLENAKRKYANLCAQCF